MNNIEIKQAILEIKEAVARDQHGGAKRYVQSLLYDAGLIDHLPRENSLIDPIPVDWTCAQFTMFDNGQPEAKRKRPYIERTKVQYGGNIKIWVRRGSDKIEFSRVSQIDWHANIYLWSADIAVKVAQEMREKKLVDQQTVDDMADIIQRSPANALFAIPKKMGAGSCWQNNHIVMMACGDDGRPEQGAIIFRGHNGDQSFIQIDHFSDELHNGRPLGNKAFGMARIARSIDFEGWATEIQTN